MRKNILTSIIVGLIFYSMNVKALSNVETTLNTSVNDKNVIVTLNVKKTNEGIDALTGKIEYDASKLVFVEAKSAHNNLKEPLYNEKNGKFTILIKSDSVITPSDIVTFKFKIKNNNKDNTEIKITQMSAATSSDKKIYLNDSKAIININNTIIDNNGNTNNKDDGKNDNTGENNKVDKPSNDNKTDEKNPDNNNVDKPSNDNKTDEKNPDNNQTNEKKEYNRYIYIILTISIILVIIICRLKKQKNN